MKNPLLQSFRIEQGFLMAKRAYEATKRSVVDATLGGHLQVFPKVEYESLFDSTGKL